MKKKELEQQQIVDLPGALEEIARLEKEKREASTPRKKFGDQPDNRRLHPADLFLCQREDTAARRVRFSIRQRLSSTKAVYSRAPIQTPGANIR